MAMPLIDRRVGRQTIEVAAAVNVPEPDAEAMGEYDIKRLVITRAVFALKGQYFVVIDRALRDEVPRRSFSMAMALRPQQLAICQTDTRPRLLLGLCRAGRASFARGVHDAPSAETVKHRWAKPQTWPRALPIPISPAHWGRSSPAPERLVIGLVRPM